RDGGQLGVHVVQRLLEPLAPERVYDALARLLARRGRTNAKGGDVVVEGAAAAGTALVMAGDARGGVEHRPQSVALGGERVPYFPVVMEQLVAGPGRRRIHLRWSKALPGKHAPADRQYRHDADQEPPGAMGPLHGV